MVDHPSNEAAAASTERESKMSGFLYRELGPSGGVSGTLNPQQIPDDATIVRIRIEAGDWVNRVILYWEAGSESGELEWGGDGGTANIVNLNLAAGEKIVGLMGTYGRPGFDFVNSLGVSTNQNIYGPYGNVPGPAQFVYEVPQSPVDLGGFFIRNDDHQVVAFGAILREMLPQGNSPD